MYNKKLDKNQKNELYKLIVIFNTTIADLKLYKEYILICEEWTKGKNNILLSDPEIKKLKNDYKGYYLKLTNKYNSLSLMIDSMIVEFLEKYEIVISFDEYKIGINPFVYIRDLKVKLNLF